MFLSKSIICLLLLAISVTIVVGAAVKSKRDEAPQSIVYDQSQNGRENFFVNIKNVHVAILASKGTGSASIKPSNFDSIKDTFFSYLYQLKPEPEPTDGLHDEYFKPDYDEPTSIEFETSSGEDFGDEETKTTESTTDTSTATSMDASTTEIPTIALTLDADVQIVQDSSYNKPAAMVVTNLIPESFSEKIKELLNMDTPKPPKMQPTEKPGLEIIETIKRKTTTMNKNSMKYL